MPRIEQTLMERLARLNRENVVDLIIPQTDTVWNSDDTEPSTTYGHWTTFKGSPTDPDFDGSKVYAWIRYCSGSDYSGDLVEVSNHRAMLAEMPSEYESGLEYLEYSGGHGTFGLAIRANALTDEMLDSLESLGDYPLLDESLHSELEIEAQNAAWEDWAKSEFKTELGKYMLACFERAERASQRDNESDADYAERLADTEQFLLDDCGGIQDNELVGIFYDMADRSNTNWENEQAADMHIDIERVVKRGLEPPKAEPDETRASWYAYHADSYARLIARIKSAMSDAKYDLGLVRWIDPNQLSLAF